MNRLLDEEFKKIYFEAQEYPYTAEYETIFYILADDDPDDPAPVAHELRWIMNADIYE